MAKEVDFALAASDEELTKVYQHAGIVGFYQKVADAVNVGLRVLDLKRISSWSDIRMLTSYAMMAGYILGVRNERKRRNRKGA